MSLETQYWYRISAFSDRMAMHRFGYLTECYNLQEEYKPLALRPKEVEASLENAYYDLELIENLTKEQFFQKLDDEFSCIGVIFSESEENLNNRYKKIKYANSGIIGGLYNQNTNTIIAEVNNIFIENFFNMKFELLAKDLIDVIGHEDAHKQQWAQSGGKIKGVDTETLNFTSHVDLKKYYGNKAEISAHAREFALWLTKLDWSSKQIQNAIKNNDPILLNCLSYKIYWENFGIMVSYKGSPDEDILERIRIWRAFLHKTIIYLRTEMRYQFSLENDFF